MYFCFCKKQQQQQQKPELKFIDVNFFKTFRVEFSYRRISIGTSGKKLKHCLPFPVVLITYVNVSWSKTYIFVGSINSSTNNCFDLFSLYSVKIRFSRKTHIILKSVKWFCKSIDWFLYDTSFYRRNFLIDFNLEC